MTLNNLMWCNHTKKVKPHFPYTLNMSEHILIIILTFILGKEKVFISHTVF